MFREAGESRADGRARRCAFAALWLLCGSIAVAGSLREARATSEPPPGARAVMQQTVDDVIAVLRNREISADERVAAVREIAYTRFDFRTMSKLVLARNWKRLDEAQQTEFVEEFRNYLSREYGRRVEGYAQEEVLILGEREEPRGDVTVRTRIVGGDVDGADVDYRLRRKQEIWRVIDVVIEGISLVSNYRDQFRSLLSGNDGPEKLLVALREKNAERETLAGGD